MMLKLKQFIPDWKQLLKIVGYIVLLYVLQVFVIVPLVSYVVGSDYFGSTDTFEPANDQMGQAAALECGEFFRQDYPSEQVSFPDRDQKIWHLGENRYLVKFGALVPGDLGLDERINIACYVKYLGGDSYDNHNWELKGLDYRLQSEIDEQNS